MPVKRASEIEEGDVIVDDLGFLRIVVNIITFPMKIIGWTVGLVFSDHSSEFRNAEQEVTYLEDERGM